MKLIRSVGVPLILITFFCVLPDVSFSQDPEPAGAAQERALFFAGAGPYNLLTADPSVIDSDGVKQWKIDLRNIVAERRAIQTREDSKVRPLYTEEGGSVLLREHAWRTKPSKTDVQNGRALNALLWDLTNPTYSSKEWSSKPVPLPKDLPLQELSFRFTSPGNATGMSKTLSDGTIAFSKLQLGSDRWPAAFATSDCEKERQAYEQAATKIRSQIIENKFQPETLAELDEAIKVLEAKLATMKFSKQAIRNETKKFVQDLKDASRILVASNIEWLRAIRADMDSGSPQNVAELVSFMLKYRLQFANAEWTYAGLQLCQPIYDAMQEQIKLLSGDGATESSAELPEFQKTKSGLKYRVLREGAGAKPNLGSIVACQYSGWLDNKTVFDSSYLRDKPAIFRVNAVIPGWVEGLQLMNVGSKFEFEIPPDLGYGTAGSGGAIPPNATLHFTVELINFQ